MVKVIIIFVLFISVTGIKLPGSCPNVPPTQYNCTDQLYSEIIFGIPFSAARHSYLFHEINGRFKNSESVVLKFTLAGDQITSKLEWIPETSLILRSIGNVTTQSPSILLKGTIYEQINDPKTGVSYTPSKCHKSIYEDIRMWCQGEFVLIWSCDNNTATEEHDEALILSVDASVSYLDKAIRRYQYEYKAYNKMMKRFNETARMYLSQSKILRMSQIEWIRHDEVKMNNEIWHGLHYFPCTSSDNFTIIGFSLFFILIVVFVILMIW